MINKNKELFSRFVFRIGLIRPSSIWIRKSNQRKELFIENRIYKHVNDKRKTIIDSINGNENSEQ